MILLRLKRYFFDYRLRAGFLLCLSIFCALSLVSYNQYDQSINTAGYKIVSNICGPVGAYVSDLLLQFFGVSSALLVLVLITWSIVLWHKTEVSWYPARLVAIFASMVALSLFLGLLGIEILPSGLGGAIGALYSNHISGLESDVSILLIPISALLFMLATGFNKEDLMQLVNRSKTEENVQQGDNIVMQARPQRKAVNKTQDTLPKNQLLPIQNISSNFDLPTLDLLGQYANQAAQPMSQAELEQMSEDLLQVLSDFGVKGRILEINQGPVVTLFEFEPSAGTKSSRIIGLADDIARSLSAISTRIAVIPGRNALGIELPNKKREFFSLRDLVATKEYSHSGFSLPIILGKDLGGKPAVVDLAKMPHLLVAGTTGSGKSVAINAMIISLLYRHPPDTCKFIMIDPKMLELSVYDGIPHLLTPVVTEPGKAVVALKWAVKEMENRYRLMSNLNVRNIAGYNERIQEAKSKGLQLERTAQTGFDPETGKPIYDSVPIEMETLPFIVIIVDEMADLMIVAGKDIEASIQRLAQMARAAGIHIIMATQRPSVDVITGVIKANFPSRVSFKVTSKIDSRTILGEQGAEQLLGMGDMLYMGNNSKISRFHGPFVDDREVENITQFLKAQAQPDYINGLTESNEDDAGNADDIMLDSGADDEGLYRQAVQIVQRDRKVSTSYIQRCLRIGYNRAALIVERMEKEGLVSTPNHAGKREILMPEM